MTKQIIETYTPIHPDFEEFSQTFIKSARETYQSLGATQEIQNREFNIETPTQSFCLVPHVMRPPTCFPSRLLYCILERS